MPYLYGEECATILSKFLEAKHRLMPYLYEQSIVAHETGVPVMRTMALEFEEDPTCALLDKQVRIASFPRLTIHRDW